MIDFNAADLSFEMPTVSTEEKPTTYKNRIHATNKNISAHQTL